MLPTTSTDKTEEKLTVQPLETKKPFFSNYDVKSLLVFAALMFIFSFFMILPILSTSVSAFNLSDPSNFLEYFNYCFSNSTYFQSILNALFAGLTTTLICSIIGLTVTIIFARYQFRGKRVFQILAVIPLVSPPFVGAFALGRLLARNGIISNLLQTFIPGLPDLLGSSIWGLK